MQSPFLCCILLLSLYLYAGILYQQKFIYQKSLGYQSCVIHKNTFIKNQTSKEADETLHWDFMNL